MARLFSSLRIATSASTGIATAAAGPSTVYQSVSSLVVPAPRDGDRSAAHAEARNLLSQVEGLHRVEFPAASRTVVPEPRLPGFPKLLATAQKQALQGVGAFDRRARRTARRTGRRQAEAWAADLLTVATHERETKQMSLDARWAALVANETSLVAATVAHAYAATDAPARLITVVDGVGFVEVRGPRDSEVPAFKPWQSSRGAATVLKLNRTERSQLHRLLVAAHVLLVAKQTLGVAPGLTGLRLIVMRPDSSSLADPILAVTISRERLASADFSLPAGQVLDRVAEDLIVRRRGVTGELQSIHVAEDSAYSLFLR